MNATRLEHSLNGEWRLVLDPDNVGVKRRWFASPPSGDAMAVQVPSVWDRWVPEYDGAGWYFREFEMGPEWLGRMISLEFEAADYYAEVWVNGLPVGAHEGGYTPFSLDVTAAARVGANAVAVRIVDPHGRDGFQPFRPRQIPCSKEDGYFSFAGLWGGVSLLGRDPAHILDVFVQPDPRRTRIAVDVAASRTGELRLAIEGTPFETRGEPGTLLVAFPEFEPWSPAHPRLYTLRCALLQDGRVADETTVRFGMREFTAREGRFYLNNQPFFVKGVLHQPDYPRTLVAPESEELARRELQAARDAGFNMVRMHIKTPPRVSLDIADEIGLLVYEEPPIGWIQNSEHMRARCEREVREMILRDRNHPSVVIWGMLNESGNAGYQVGGGAQLIKDDLCRLARSLDPSRVIIDDSGGVNTTRESSRMMRPYRDEFEAYDDLHIYQRAPVDREIELYYEHSGTPETLVFLSEFGFGGMEDLEDVLAQYGDERQLKDAQFIEQLLARARQGFEERGLERLFGSFAQFTAAARQLQCDAALAQIDALRVNPKLAGYCYTQLCDAGHEFCAGVLDRWRRPKPVLTTLRDVQAPLRPIIRADRTNLVPRQEIKVTVIMANDERLEGRADLSLQVVGPTNQVLWKKKRNLKLPRSGKELWNGTVSASGSLGRHQFVVRLMQGMKVLGESALELHVFEPAPPCAIEAHVLDPTGPWAAACARVSRPGRLRAPIHVVPPLANTIRAYPADDLTAVLGQVHGGAVAVFFGPPDDFNDLAEQIDPELRATSKDAVGAFLGTYHYTRIHPVFEKLPGPGLMRQPYRNVVPPRTFLERGDEEICGAFDTTPIATGNYMMGEGSWWGNDILVRRFGDGRIVFTHLRLLEHLGKDPVADRLFVNLINHFSRRSLPSDAIMPQSQRACDWLRGERGRAVRHWKVLGMFPNWGGKGHDEAYPPEREIDLHATYLGWYKPIQWRSWYSLAGNDHIVNLQDAFTPVYEYYPRFDYGTGYAYAELSSDRRQDATMRLGVQDATKVWLNGSLVFASDAHLPYETLEEHKVRVMLKQGKNTCLVKVSKIPGEFRFSLDLEATGRDPLNITWWR